MPLRKAKTVYNFGLSECNRVKKTQKMWLLKTDDPIIEVTKSAGLTVYTYIQIYIQKQQLRIAVNTSQYISFTQ